MLLRILHISDLHERGSHERERFRRDLVLGKQWERNLQEICEDGPIHLVCFTGDVAYSGKEHEYTAATQFIVQLKELLQLDDTRFFLVPGNHDVDRSCNKSAYLSLRNAVDGQVNRLQLSRWMSGIGGPPPGLQPEWRQEILARQDSYRKWVETLELAVPSQSIPPALGYRVSLELPGLPVVHIIGLNTAWLAGENDQPGNLLLTDDQLLRLASDPDGTPLKGLRIALMHHPFSDLADGKQIQRLMAGRVDIVLRGHLHCTESSHFIIDTDRQFAEFAVSSLFDGGSADQYPNGCQVLTLRDRRPNFTWAGTNRFRSWSPQGYFWYDDNSLYAETRNGRLEWVLSSFRNRPLILTAHEQNASLSPDYSLSDYLRQLRRNVSRESIQDGLIRPDQVYVSQFAQEGEAGPKIKLLDAMESFWNGNQRRIAILANYGMGKTYFALKTVLEQVYAFSQPAGKRVPIYFRLRNFNIAEATAGSDDEKQDIVDQILKEMLALDFPPIKREEFVQLIKDGKVGIILDGLDELNIPRTISWQKVLEPLLSIADGHYAVTSRTAFIQDKKQELDGWKTYEIQEWGDEEWHDYVSHSARSSQEFFDVGGTEAFLKLIDNRPQLSRLTTRPLWCYMIVAIRNRIQTHSDITIVSLYQEFLNEVLERVMRHRVVVNQILTEKEKYHALERFAEICAIEDKSSLDEQRFLALLNKIFLKLGLERLKEHLAKEIKVYSFLNCDLRNHYSFGHKSFAEYFLAAGAARQLIDNSLKSNGDFRRKEQRHAYIARQELTQDQLNFLAGIIDSEDAVRGLNILQPDIEYADARHQTIRFIESQLLSKRTTSMLRRNLLLTYLPLLRNSSDRPRLIGFDLKEIHLPKINLRDCDLEDVNFSGANLVGADFRNSTLKKCRFQRAVLDETNFSGADLESADFTDASPPVKPPIFENVRNIHLALLDDAVKQFIVPERVRT